MIFSEQKWNNGLEFQRVIKASSAMEFISIETILSEAYNLFIVPLLGEEMIKRLENEYNNDIENTNLLVLLAQRANANLAVWYNFYELTVILSGSGIQRAETGDYQGLYKYQELQLRENYKQKGFNALDDVLIYLESHIEDYPEFESSPAYKERKTSIIRGAEEVQRYLDISRSRITFLRLQPHIRFIEETRLPAFLGAEIVKLVADQLYGKAEADDKVEEMIQLIRPVVVLLAAARLIRQNGILTDKGLFFASIKPTSGESLAVSPADRESIEIQAKLYEADAHEYLSRLENFIRSNYSEYFKGKHTAAFDNDGHKIFAAI